MIKPEQMEDLHRIAAGIKNMDYVYGSGLMTPLANHVNSSRAAMVYSQIPQAKNLNNPEIARMSTGWEKMYGDRSTSFQKADKNYEIVKKIQKFKGSDMVYVLVVKDKNSNRYDLLVRNEVESFAESSGTLINNEYMDSKKVGSTIKKGDVVYKSNAYDDDMNYRLGVNAETAYLSDVALVEDALRISESLRTKLETTSVDQFTIPKNNNDIFLNLYGGNTGSYKAFPDIGEKVKDRILVARRRVDYSNALYGLKNKNLRERRFGDTTYVTESSPCSRVVDIDIYCNTPHDELPTDAAHKQVNWYLDSITNFWREIRDTVEEISSDPKNSYSDTMGIYYARAKDALSIGKHTRWNTEMSSVFDNMIIVITVASTSKVKQGSKLVGRFGNKGVISEIVPDDMMPIDKKTGKHIEIEYNALSMVGRLNPAQSSEHEENWIMDQILNSDESPKKKYEGILDFLALVNPKQGKQVERMYESLKADERKQFLAEITKDFVIFQSAEHSVSFKNYQKLIEKFDPKKSRLILKNPDGTTSTIQRKVIVAPTYVYRLKHEPITKFSARSKGTINPRTFLPIKSNAYSRGTALFNNQAIRLGNMEMDVLDLCNDPAAINYMTRLYCTSVVGRREFNRLLNVDIFKEDLEIDMDNHNSRVVDMFNATFLTCGLKLKFKFNDLTPVKDQVVDSISHMSKKDIRLVFKPEYLAKKK
jgi:DNA-directed RNA polymerase beta subunit